MSSFGLASSRDSRRPPLVGIGAVVAGGLALSVAVINPLLLLAPAGLLLGLVVFRWPRQTLLVLLIGTPLAEIPFELLPQTHVSALRDVVLAAILVAFALRRLHQRRLELPASPITAALLTFTAIVLLYMAIAPTPVQGLLGAKALIFYAALYFLIPEYLTEERDFRILVFGLASCGAILAAYAVFSFLAPQSTFPFDPQGTGTQITDGVTRLHFAAYTVFFATMLPVTWWAAELLSGRRITRAALGLVAIVQVAVIVVSGLRATWVAAAAVAMVNVGANVRRLAVVPLLAVVALVAVVLVGGDNTLVSRVATTGSSGDIGFTGRLSELQNVWIPLISAHPLGLGTGTFTSTASSTWQSVVGTLQFSYLAKGVGHNGYLEILAEQGIIGFAAYLALIGTVFGVLLNNQGRLTRPVLKAVNRLALGQVIGYSLLNFLMPAPILFPVNVYFFVSAGLAVAVRRVEALPRTK